MKTTKLLSLVILASAAVACDPYDDEKTGTPTLLSATATDLVNHVSYGASAIGDAVTIDITCADIEDEYCGAIDPTDPDFDELTDFTTLTALPIFVTFDRQVNGLTVQTSTTDCTPANGWLTVTPSPAAGGAWYSCYNPSSPSPDEGGSVVVFAAPVPTAPATISGWTDADLPVGPTPIVITGSVGGRTVTVTVNRPDVSTCACP